MNPQGYLIVQDLDGIREYDTVTCCHCNRVFVPAKNPGGFCMRCMKPICEHCANHAECKPLMKQIEQMENRKRFFKEVGI